MKSRTYFILCFLLTTILISCKKNDDSSKVITMKVAPTLEKGGADPPATPSNPSVFYYMKVTNLDSSQPSYGVSLGKIAGFEYEEGFEYVLKVRETKIDNPLADADVVKYELIEILSKIKVAK